MPDRTELVVAFADTDVEIAQRLEARFAEAGFRPLLAPFPDHLARWELPRAATAVCLFSQETAGRVMGWSGDAAVVLALVDVDEPPAGWQDAGAVVRRWDWAGGTFSRVVSVLDRTRLRGVLDVLLGSTWPVDDEPADPAPPVAVPDLPPLDSAGSAHETPAPPPTTPGDAGGREAARHTTSPAAEGADGEPRSLGPDGSTGTTGIGGDAGRGDDVGRDTGEVASAETETVSTAAPVSRADVATVLADLLTEPDSAPLRTVGAFGPAEAGESSFLAHLALRLHAADALRRAAVGLSGRPRADERRVHVVHVAADAVPAGRRAADWMVDEVLRVARADVPGVPARWPRPATGRGEMLAWTLFSLLVGGWIGVLGGGAFGPAFDPVAALVAGLGAAVITWLVGHHLATHPATAERREMREAAVRSLWDVLSAGRRRLVVLVDRVDAAPADEAAEVVRTARWLTERPGISVVLAGDAPRIGNAILAPWSAAGTGDAVERACAAVDLPLRLPPASPGEMEAALHGATRTAAVAPGTLDPRTMAGPRVPASSGDVGRTALTAADVAALEAVLPHLPRRTEAVERVATAYRLTRGLLAASGDAARAETPRAVASWLALVARWPAVAAAFAAEAETSDSAAAPALPASLASSAPTGDGDALGALFASAELTWPAVRALARVTLHADLAPPTPPPAETETADVAPASPPADRPRRAATEPRRAARRVRSAAEPESGADAGEIATTPRRSRKVAAAPAVEAAPAPPPAAPPAADSAPAADVFVDPNQLPLF